jgi:hypothetical protein
MDKQTNINSTELAKKEKIKSGNPFIHWDY